MTYGTVEGYTYDGGAYHVHCLPPRAERSDERPTPLLDGQDDEAMYGIPDGSPMTCDACLEYIKYDGAQYRARDIAVMVTLTHEDENGNCVDDYTQAWVLHGVVPGWSDAGVTDAVRAEAQRRNIPWAFVYVGEWAEVK